MNNRYLVAKDKGFILLSTMVVLLFMMIIALGTYRQAVLSTKTLGMSRFKSLASAVTEDVLNRIERDMLLENKATVALCNTSGNTCDPPSAKAIENLRIEYLKNASDSIPFSESSGVTIRFTKYNTASIDASTTNIVAYYYIQKLEEEDRSVLYRTTIVSFVLDNMDVIESGFRARID